MAARLGFTHGAVLHRERLYIGGVALELEAQDVPHALLFSRHADTLEPWSVAYRLAGLAAIRHHGVDTLVAVGEEGQVEWADDDGALEDRIGSDDPAAWPNRLRRLHGVRQVGEALYAVGAGRQVHRRALAAGEWTRHDHGCRVVAGSGDASSFHDLHGRDDDELLAVGSQGALWRWNGGQWRALAGHGEAPLHAVQYTGNGYVAAGSAGTVLRIDQDQVQPLAHAHTGETFCGIAQAFGTVYLCSEAGGLFRLDEHTVSALDIDADPDGGGHLAGSEDGLLWVTAARVRRLDHGGWHDITPD